MPITEILTCIFWVIFRFDQEDATYMSCPDNVRKVMNVEIAMRLENLENVHFINNDDWSKWGKDDVKRNRLFGSDGYHLTAYGFSMMLDHWMKTLRAIVNNAELASPDEEEEGIETDINSVSRKLQSSAVIDDSNGEVDPRDCPLVDDDDSDAENGVVDPEITEKENEEKMEKEL